MSKFKVGDRVAVYTGQSRGIGTIKCSSDELVVVRFWQTEGTYHKKQCRKLVKKKRREFWMCRNGEFELFKVYHSQYTPKELLAQYKTVIKVREVKDAAQELPEKTKSE